MFCDTVSANLGYVFSYLIQPCQYRYSKVSICIKRPTSIASRDQHHLQQKTILICIKRPTSFTSGDTHYVHQERNFICIKIRYQPHLHQETNIIYTKRPASFASRDQHHLHQEANIIYIKSPNNYVRSLLFDKLLGIINLPQVIKDDFKHWR